MMSVKSDFYEKVLAVRHAPLPAREMKVLQVNLGYRCNMACIHCHVSGGPARKETMERETVNAVIRVLRDNPIETIDITGGAPELNSSFRHLVREARKQGKRVMVRTNLTVFFEPGMGDLPGFYRDQGVELIASLPCYLEENVAAVRGRGAFKKSIDGLRKLNDLGFGKDSYERPLSLVYNPVGPFLAPLQSRLETDYKRELKNRFDITFTRLFAFTNMPVGRFRDALLEAGSYEQYLAMLAASFNPDTLDHIMCRSMMNVGWDGMLHDCDFNQVLGIPVASERNHINDFNYGELLHRQIAVDNHCFGCTAGQGST